MWRHANGIQTCCCWDVTSYMSQLSCRDVVICPVLMRPRPRCLFWRWLCLLTWSSESKWEWAMTVIRNVHVWFCCFSSSCEFFPINPIWWMAMKILCKNLAGKNYAPIEFSVSRVAVGTFSLSGYLRFSHGVWQACLLCTPPRWPKVCARVFLPGPFRSADSAFVSWPWCHDGTKRNEFVFIRRPVVLICILATFQSRPKLWSPKKTNRQLNVSESSTLWRPAVEQRAKRAPRTNQP